MLRHMYAGAGAISIFTFCILLVVFSSVKKLDLRASKCGRAAFIFLPASRSGQRNCFRSRAFDKEYLNKEVCHKDMNNPFVWNKEWPGIESVEIIMAAAFRL